MGHPLHRHLFIADNLNLRRRLDNGNVDLICIDPPYPFSTKYRQFHTTLWIPAFAGMTVGAVRITVRSLY